MLAELHAFLTFALSLGTAQIRTLLHVATQSRGYVTNGVIQPI